MSVRGLELTNAQRLLAEEVTESEIVGAAPISRLMLAQLVATIPIGVQPQPFAAYLEAASSPDLAVDGSTTTVNFTLAPADPDIYRIERLRLVLSCATAVDLSDFGDLAALTNGLSLRVRGLDGLGSPVDLYDPLDGATISSGLDLAELGVVTVPEATIMVADIVPAAPIRLEGGLTESLRLTVADNLSGLTRARCRAIGCVENRRS